MRMSRYLLPTLREDPSHAESPSHKLMLRAGLVRKLAAGIYSFLPLGYRVLKNIQKIVEEEMDAAGAQQLLMPALHPAEIWKETGRWEAYGKEMFRLKDRGGRDFGLGPTHEEIITHIVRSEVKSYRKLPLILYQIQTKFRDEPRPRFGIVRAREFIMKDAYSFDRDEAGLEESYKKMFDAYCRIFDRCGLKYVAVEAPTGLIGGSVSHEFLVPAPSGEDKYLECFACGYAANLEVARSVPGRTFPKEDFKPLKEVHTPGVRTVEEVSNFLKVPAWKLVKSLVVVVEGEPALVLINGEDDLSLERLSRSLGVEEVFLAPSDVVEEVTRAPVGFAGPVGLKIPIYADVSLKGLYNFVSGANREDYHYININFDRDFKVTKWVEARAVKSGDKCPRCGGTVEVKRGMEVGHVFKLGTKYSEAMRATFTDEDGSEKPFVMGCYGIGVSRLIAAIIEQNHDSKGIIWPVEVAPFKVHLLLVNVADSAQKELADSLYRRLVEAGWDVLYDDRDESPGVKFNDMDLIGIPFRVIVGPRGIKEGKVEVSERKRPDVRNFIKPEKVISWLEGVAG